MLKGRTMYRWPLRVTFGCWALCSAVAGVLAVSGPLGSAYAFQGEELPSELAVPYADTTVVDFTAPVPGVLTAPASAKANPIVISYSETLDAGGSNLKSVSLWVKEGSGGLWADSGLSSTEPSGSFEFSGLNGQGRYFFALVAEDNAGNRSPEPVGDSTTSTVFDSEPPVITRLGSSPVALLQGQAYTDAGATATDNVDGDVTAKIVVANNVNPATPGTYSVTYNVSDTAGNAAVPVSREVTVGATFGLTITQPAQGTIAANPGPNAGTRYAPGTNVTLTYAADAAGKFEINAWTGADAVSGIPHQANVVMNANTTVTASVKRITGTVQIDVNPNNAPWIFTNGDGGKQTGAGDTTLSNVPTGVCNVVFQPLSGFKEPDAFDLTLAKAQTIKFTGTYTPMEGVTLSMPLNIDAKPGQTVNVPINVSSAADITSYSFVVTFDSKVADCTGVAAGSLTGGWAAPTRTINVGSVSVSGSGAVLGDAAGSLVVLKIRAKDTLTTAAQTPLTFGTASLNGGGINATSENGSLKVALGGFLWGDVDKSGVVDATDAAKIMQFIVGSLATLPSASDGTSGEVVGDVSGDSPSALGGVDAALIFQKLDAKVSKFPADFNGDTMGPDTPPTSGTPPKPFAETLAEGAGSGTRELTMPGQVQLQAGAQITVPVRLNNASRVLTYFLDLDYDGNFLEFVNASKGSLTTDWTEPIVQSATAGQLAVVAAGSTELAGSGELLKLTFRVKGSVVSGQTAELGFANAMLNDGLFPCDVSVVEAAPIIQSVVPNMGSTTGGTVVTLKGTNLADVDTVLFGSGAGTVVESSRRVESVNVIVPPGTGTVNVKASSFGLSGQLNAAFTYFTPDVQLDVDAAPEVNAGQVLQVPILVTNTGTPAATKLKFILVFDPTMFTLPPGTGAAVVLGQAGTQAKVVIDTELTRPGEVTFEVTSTSPIPNGTLCTASLLAIGNLNETMGVIYLRDPNASSSSKSLNAGAGVTGGE